MKFLPLLIAVVALADYLLAQTLTCPTGSSLTGTYTSTSTSSTINWKNDCTQKTISMSGTFTGAQGWVSIGWNTNGAMAPADTVMAWLGGTTPYILDSSTSGYAAPTQDTTNHLTATSITKKGTTTVLNFTRAYLTADTQDIAFNKSATMYIILATGAAAPTGNAVGNAQQHTATDSAKMSFFGAANAATATAGAATATGTAAGGKDAACATAGAKYSGSYATADGAWKITWVINCDAQTFSAIMSSKAAGWVAFGINSGSAAMSGADVFQAGVTGGTVSTISGRCAGRSAPTKAATSIYTQYNGTEAGGVTTIGFTRPLAPTTEAQITSAGTNLLWAYHATSDDLTQFHTGYAVVNINFFTGQSSTTTNLTLVHGSVMILAWGFLAIFGTFFARYLKGIGHLWYQAHLALQYSVLILTIIGLIVIEKQIGSGSGHFASAHAVLGILIVIGTFVQVALGILSNKLWTPDREGIPAFPDQIHWWLGRSVILFSVINIFMGFDLYGFTQTDYGPVVAFGFWIAVVYIVYLFVDMSMGPGIHEHKHDGPPNPTKQEIYQANRTPINATAVMAFVGVILFAITLQQTNK